MMHNSVYKKSFEKFLASTNEKRVIKQAIESNASLEQINSLLDIGAGNGVLTKLISEGIERVVCVEPNAKFAKDLKGRGFDCITQPWEDVNLNSEFDLVLAAYVCTHFSREKLPYLIDKMITHLKEGGKLIVLCVDEDEGSWRKAHTFFYDLIGLEKESSTVSVRDILVNKYNAISKNFTTLVEAQTPEEMVEILTFDFYKYGDLFENNKEKLVNYLKKYVFEGKVRLEMIHQMYIVSK